MRIIASVLLIVLLASCEHRRTDAACASLQPITYSASRDTAETVMQIRQNNAALLVLCPQFKR